MAGIGSATSPGTPAFGRVSWAAHNRGMHTHTVSLRRLGLLGVLALTACSPYVGVGVPVGPFNVGVGVGSGGVSAGVGTGVGPVGVGVGVGSSGQVTGHAGVGTSVPVGGGAHVGAGVGTSTVLHSPGAESAPPASPPAPAPAASEATTAPLQWRDAHGNVVPECRVRGRC